MKKVSMILTACVAFAMSSPLDALAEKQGKIEKLYESLAKNEKERFDKTKERIDPETAAIYKNEIALANAIGTLVYEPDFSAAEPYFKSSFDLNEQDQGARLRSICDAGKISLDTLLQKADSMIYIIIVTSDDQLTNTRNLVGMLAQYKYAMTPEYFDKIIAIKEEVQFTDLKNQPDRAKCESYFKDFDTRFNYPAVVEIYNELLYKAVCNKPDEANILTFLNDSILKTYYANPKEKRAYLPEVQKIYDNYLFSEINNAKTPQATREKIKAYVESPYMAGSSRSYLTSAEYKKDSIDYVALAASVDSTSRLPLVKKYLEEHKYKEFKDKAQQLAEKFILNKTWSSPTASRFYAGNKLIKETSSTNDSTASVTYNYNEQGKLLSTLQRVVRKNGTPVMYVTTFKYNDLGKCHEEETTDSISQKPIGVVSYHYNATGYLVMKHIVRNNNTTCIESYTPQGKIAQVQEYMNGKIITQTDFAYDPQGRLVQKTWSNLKPDNSTSLIKQITEYTYDPYGYLTNASYTKENLQNEKISGNQPVSYDPFGNRIDPNYAYEYGPSGAWILKVGKLNPTDSEKIVHVYK